MNENKSEETAIQNVSEEVKEVGEKPYCFRKLGFKDIFSMMKLVNKIGLDKILKLIDDKAILSLIQGKKPMKLDEEGNEIVDEDEYMKLLGKAIVSIVQLIISCLGDCEHELYTVLSNCSNLEIKEIEELELKYVSSMIIDFIKKDDFKDFFKGLLGSMHM